MSAWLHSSTVPAIASIDIHDLLLALAALLTAVTPIMLAVLNRHAKAARAAVEQTQTSAAAANTIAVEAVGATAAKVDQIVAQVNGDRERMMRQHHENLQAIARLQNEVVRLVMVNADLLERLQDKDKPRA